MPNNIELLSNTENFTIGTNSNLSEILANVVRVGTDTSNVTISIPQDISSSYNLILPVRQGASGESLVYGADGQLTWRDTTVLKQIVSVYGDTLTGNVVSTGIHDSPTYLYAYTANITPMADNSKIFVQFKVNYHAALSASNQISFFIKKSYDGNETIFTESLFGPYNAVGGFTGQYISNLVDEALSNNQITYQLGYKINGTVDISDTLGILGYDTSYNNTIVLQEFEGSGSNATSVWNKGSDSNGLYYNEGTVHIGSTKNALDSQNTTGVALELSGNLVGTHAYFSGQVNADIINAREGYFSANTLYINNKPVLNEDAAGNITVNTDVIVSDASNGLTIKAIGDNGNIILDPSGTGSIQLNGDVQLSGGNINAETFIGDLSGNVNAVTMTTTTTTTNNLSLDGTAIRFNIDNKWEIRLDASSNFILENTAISINSIIGDANSGKITLYDYNLEDLENVTITDLSNGQILKYNSTASTWENVTDPSGVETLNDLTDVTITNLANGQILKYNSTASTWENVIDPSGVETLNDLTDVTITNAGNGQILQYNDSNEAWENATLPTGVETLNDLTDVTITNLANGQILKYNSTASTWENVIDPSGVETLNDLTDVTITNAGNGQILKYNSTISVWENVTDPSGVETLNDLTDVTITNLANGQILKYNSTASTWENVIDPSGVETLNDLTDVTITNAGNGQILKYNSTISVWENVTDPSGVETLNDLTDVTITNLANGQILMYNDFDEQWQNSLLPTGITLLSELTDVAITNAGNGQILIYNDTNEVWENNTPTYLDGANLEDNFLIKSVNNQADSSYLYSTATTTTNQLEFNIPTDPSFNVLSGVIQTTTNALGTTRRMNLATSNIENTRGITITETGRVGIGILNPEEDLQIEGKLRIDDANTQTITFYDTQGGQTSEHGRIELTDNGGGADLLFYTRPSGGNEPTEKLRIDKNGAVGIGGANYGTTGQVLISNGSGSAVSWANQTDTTYSAGTGVMINQSNVISIGQEVSTSDGVTFKSLNLEKNYLAYPIIDPIINFIDNQAAGTLSQIQSVSDGVSGGKLKFFTKKITGFLTERLNISEGGVVKIKTDSIGLQIASTDGVTEQGYIYNSGFGTKDFIMDAAAGSSTKGITFRTGGGNDRMRISDTGNVGIGTITPRASLDVVGGGGVWIENADRNVTHFNLNNENLNYIRGHLEVTNSSKISLMGGQNGGTGRGLYFFSIGDTNWGQYMGQSGTNRSFSGGIATAGYGFDSYAMRFRVAASNSNGWIFENSNEDRMFCVRGADGLGYFKGAVYSQTSYLTSDDRIKFNEKSLTDGLEVIRQLVPQEYMKSKKINVEEDLEKEIGLIAQEVKEIPQLEHVVVGQPDNPEAILNVNYTQIFVYGLQAIKELDKIVEEQKIEMNKLKEENLLMKEKLNELLLASGKETI